MCIRDSSIGSTATFSSEKYVIPDNIPKDTDAIIEIDNANKTVVIIFFIFSPFKALFMYKFIIYTIIPVSYTHLNLLELLSIKYFLNH